MTLSENCKKESAVFRLKPRSYSNAGSVLVYLIVVILIFGVLGVTMVSLFTTATTSSATPNCARRAFQMYESGVRYAFSELKDKDFDEDTINDLNSTSYNVTDAGNFSINLFSPWFESPSLQEGSNYTITLNVPAGKLPAPPLTLLDLAVPGDLWAINFEYLKANTNETGVRSPISAYTRVDDTTLNFDVSSNFSVSTGERVCLGVKPTEASTSIIVGNDLFDDLYVERIAKDFFPRFNGAININRVNYSYERLVDDPPNRVRLENISASFMSNTLTPPSPLVVENKTTNGTYSGHFIVLSPRNLMVIPTGTSCSDIVSYGGDHDDGMNIFRYSLPPIPSNPDIDADEFTSNLTENETSSSFISVDTAADKLKIGGNTQAEYGAGWYNADKSIGGTTNACQTGKCLFGLGIRVFFVVKFIEGRQGDGFTFTLMNAEGREPPPSNILLNDINSVGGDFERSELMGYAGDSRKEDDSFLDTTDPRGIQPPKMAIEFDTQTNFDAAFESELEPKNYCIDSSLRLNTRNDPSPGNSDAVQYVFWGDSSLNVPCRSANPDASVDTYDDNRHGTTESPINDIEGFKSKDDLDSSVEVDDADNWLNGSTFRGPWAIRIEIDREEFPNTGENPDYTIQTWIRQCSTDAGSSNCTDESIVGDPLNITHFQNTRLKYDFPPEPTSLRLSQTVELTPIDHNAFERFFFGFTGAAGSEALDVEISQFQLSFIRPGDPEVTSDSNWTP